MEISTVVQFGRCDISQRSKLSVNMSLFLQFVTVHAQIILGFCLFSKTKTTFQLRLQIKMNILLMCLFTCSWLTLINNAQNALP